ncbi:MAG: DUF433 domain-containing protein [Micrococcales bacterium]|nr:DUF433 domain-containing protein [Micrococcales bacterium]
MVTSTLDDDLVLPLYTLRETAQIIGMPANTLHTWARGYRFKGVDGRQHDVDALVTTTSAGRGPVVPFIGLSEAYVLNAFRTAGVPMQRIRPAVTRLADEFGLQTALASEQLKTDGAEVLWQFGEETADPELRDRLVVVRNGQMVFTEVVERYLRTITYRNGRVAVIQLPQFTPKVVVDPRRNFGRPTIDARGIRVDDVRDRLAAGEPVPQVAADYRLDLAVVESLAA